MAHAAGAPDVNIQVGVITVDGAANGLTQLKTTATRGHGILNHVHRKGNDRARPGNGGRLGARRYFRHGGAAHQRQRHGEPVVHRHFVHDGQVKIVLNHALRNVTR